MEEIADPLGTEGAEAKMMNKIGYEDLEAGGSSHQTMVASPTEEQDVVLLTKMKVLRQGTMKQKFRKTVGVTVWVNSEKEETFTTFLCEEDVSLDPLSNAPARPKSPPKPGVIHNVLQLKQRSDQEREQLQSLGL